MASEKTKEIRALTSVELRTDRWKDKKYLSPINYLRQIRRDLQDEDTVELRTKLLTEIRKAKEESKKFIAEYRLRGWLKTKSKKR